MSAVGLVPNQETHGRRGRNRNVKALKYSCVKHQDFITYANDNMRQLGLTPVENMGDTVDQALVKLGTMAGTVAILGKGATVAELVLATTIVEKIAVGATLYASYYVGAYIGSFAVATGKYLSCGSSIADALTFIEDNNIKFNNAKVFFANNLEILSTTMPNREAFVKRSTVG